MKVVDKNLLINIESYRNNAIDKKSINQQKSGKTNALVCEDKVALSPQARQIQEAKTIIESIPDIREDRVADLKRRIENNTYQIDPKKIADRMINTVLKNDILTTELS